MAKRSSSNRRSSSSSPSSPSKSAGASITQLCLLLLLGIVAVAVQDLKLLTTTVNVSLVRQLREEESGGRMLQSQDEQGSPTRDSSSRALPQNQDQQQALREKAGPKTQQQSRQRESKTQERPTPRQRQPPAPQMPEALSSNDQQQRALQEKQKQQPQKQQQQPPKQQQQQQQTPKLQQPKQQQLTQRPNQPTNEKSPLEKKQEPHRSLQSVSDPGRKAQQPALPPYSSRDILSSMSLFHTWDMRLLLWDGDAFHAFGVGHDNATRPEFGTTPRLNRLVPFLVHALRTNFPGRFVRGESEVFELLFTEADLISSFCSLDRPCADERSVPPILAFGSMYKNASILPSVQLMPTPSRWFKCMYSNHLGSDAEPAACQLGSKAANAGTGSVRAFEDLKPQLAWRGTDWQFLPHLQDHKYDSFSKLVWQTTSEHQVYADEDRASALKRLQGIRHDMNPRWKAALLTLEADEETGDGGASRVPWIDSRFVEGGGMNAGYRSHLAKLGLRVNGDRVEEEDLAGNRYQADWGGGGGTTWDGTLGKLIMPGLLFHHETPTMDWFHGEMVAWKHYVPVATDLSDLKHKFEWAEKHPQSAKAIAAEGTRLAERLLSLEYQQETYQKLFVDYLGRVIDAYRPPSPSDGSVNPGDAPLRSRLLFYRRSGVHVNRLSHCNVKACRTLQQNGDFKSMRHARE